MTDYFSFRFYGSYNFTIFLWALLIYDFILENIFKILKLNITNGPPFLKSMFLAQM